jgi:hypothetical protein
VNGAAVPGGSGRRQGDGGAWTEAAGQEGDAVSSAWMGRIYGGSALRVEGRSNNSSARTPGWGEVVTARQGETKGDDTRLASCVDRGAAWETSVQSREVGGSHPRENGGGMGFSSHAGWAPKCPYGARNAKLRQD